MTEFFAELTNAGGACSLRFVREYATAAADLWAAVTTPERVSRWLAPAEGSFVVGGQFAVHFDDGVAQFEVVRCEPPRRAEVHWTSGVGATLVRLSVSAIGAARARLVLEHEGLRPMQAPGYATGWHWHLQTLGDQLADGGAPAALTWDELAGLYGERFARV